MQLLYPLAPQSGEVVTGLAPGSMFSACSMSSLGMPGMFTGHQAEISQSSWRNSTSAFSYVEYRLSTIEVLFVGLIGWTCTSRVSLAESKAWSGKDRPAAGITSWLVESLSSSYSAGHAEGFGELVELTIIVVGSVKAAF
jgi:hypothetical protein